MTTKIEIPELGNCHSKTVKKYDSGFVEIIGFDEESVVFNPDQLGPLIKALGGIDPNEWRTKWQSKTRGGEEIKTVLDMRKFGFDGTDNYLRAITKDGDEICCYEDGSYFSDRTHENDLLPIEPPKPKTKWVPFESVSEVTLEYYCKTIAQKSVPKKGWLIVGTNPHTDKVIIESVVECSDRFSCLTLDDMFRNFVIDGYPFGKEVTCEIC